MTLKHWILEILGASLTTIAAVLTLWAWVLHSETMSFRAVEILLGCWAAATCAAWVTAGAYWKDLEAVKMQNRILAAPASSTRAHKPAASAGSRDR